MNYKRFNIFFIKALSTVLLASDFVRHGLNEKKGVQSMNLNFLMSFNDKSAWLLQLRNLKDCIKDKKSMYIQKVRPSLENLEIIFSNGVNLVEVWVLVLNANEEYGNNSSNF
jgi:hypothetical protein